MSSLAVLRRRPARQLLLPRTPETLIARTTTVRAVRSAALWGAVFGLYLAVSALGYASTYPTQVERAALAATFGHNVGVNALIGPAHSIQTVRGFVAWRSLGVLGVAGAVWGLLTSTRLLRGEEDAGRWELLLCGATTRGRATVQALGGLAVGLSVLWALPTASLLAVGRSADVQISASAAVFAGFATVSTAAVFLAVGALTSQLAATRRRAAGYAAAALGVSYAVRMVADSGTGLDWLRWTSPLGWAEELRPLTGSHAAAALPVVLVVVACGAAAAWLAAGRDLGASTLPDRDTARPRTGLLSGTLGLTVRLIRGSVAAWAAATVLGGMLLGLVAKSAGTALAESATVREVIGKLGAGGGGARAYLGVAYLILALVVALLAAGQVSAARAEESDGRLEHLLVRPVGRVRWLLTRAGVAIVAIVAVAVLAAVATWAAGATQHAGVGLGRLLGAGINLVPPAILVLGGGLLVMGLRPRAATAAAYFVLSWSFLLELVGSVVGADHWLLDTSVFHHLAAAPAADPAWPTDAVVVAIGVLAAAVGTAAFARRDVTGQ